MLHADRQYKTAWNKHRAGWHDLPFSDCLLHAEHGIMLGGKRQALPRNTNIRGKIFMATLANGLKDR